MIIITARNKDTNTYKCYSVDNAINVIEKLFRSNHWYYNDFKVEFNNSIHYITTTNYKTTNAITIRITQEKIKNELH